MTQLEDLIVPASVAALVLFAAGVLIVWVAKRAANGRLGRNQIAGIRTSVTLSSDAAWLAAHRAAESPTIVAGTGTAVGGALTLVTALVGGQFLSADALPITVAIVALSTAGWLLAWTIWGGVVGQRAAAATLDDTLP